MMRTILHFEAIIDVDIWEKFMSYKAISFLGYDKQHGNVNAYRMLNKEH